MTELETENQTEDMIQELESESNSDSDDALRLTEEEVKSYEQVFAEKVAIVKQKMKEDPDVVLQALAEIHVMLFSFEQSMRSMMMNGGPRSMLRFMMGRKSK